jgi:hypothetical protein
MKELDVLKAAEKVIMGIACLVGVAFFVSGFRFVSAEDAALRFVVGGVLAVGSGIFLWSRRRSRHAMLAK